MSKIKKMTEEAARRIQSAADRNPKCASAKTGFKARARRAADRNNLERSQNAASKTKK